MRCIDCNKFVALETGEPEVDVIDIDEDGVISIAARIRRICANCGIELREVNLSFTDALRDDVVAEHTGSEHELSVEENGVEIVEEGIGRKARFGVELTVTVDCKCGKLDESVFMASGTAYSMSVVRS